MMIDIIHVSQDPLGVQMYYFPQGHLQRVLEEIKLLFAVAGTMIFTGLHLFSKSCISTYDLGHIGISELAGASHSMAFVNVTGFSVISGMDGITSQDFVALYLRAKKVTKPFVTGATTCCLFSCRCPHAYVPREGEDVFYFPQGHLEQFVIKLMGCFLK
ncbi:protein DETOXIFICATION 48 [Artemisia annua]|uniref:Protein DETOXIFICATION 48 n=1 Tax=Artemisia annua TaxID=35608 RepID=A0A2U1MTC3_ARTAN|nr:protein DETOXIFICATION 48 [Artemisia annua]